MKLSVVIPAHNEAESLPITLNSLYKHLHLHDIEHEILVVDDHSSDQTLKVIEDLKHDIPTLSGLENIGDQGFGFTIRMGLDHTDGDCVAIMMADLSDSAEDLVLFYDTMIKKQVDCVFGSRFIKGAKVHGYPKAKYVLNRLANNLVRMVFRLKYNDITNAFKLYKRETIEGLRPFLSPQFNLTLELPLKAIVRGYTYEVVPNSWTNRRFGKSNLKIREMGSRYFFIFLYCLIEKYFSKGDYRKSNI